MSADNNHLKNREIQALRQEQPRPDARGELIMALLKPKRESKMSILRKASLPTLVSIAAIAGVFYVAQPRVVAATPERVIKAIQDIKNYTINSFTIEGNERHLQSKTSVNGKDRKTVYYDVNGAESKSGGPSGAVLMKMNDSPMKMGFSIDSHGDLKDMSKEELEKVKGSIHISSGSGQSVVIDGSHAPGSKNIKVQVTKDANGKEVKHFFIDGKEVDKLPDDIGANVHILGGGISGGGKKDVRVEVKKGPDGKEVKRYFINGKEVDKLPSDVNVKIGAGKVGKDLQEVKVQVTKDANGKEVKRFFLNGKQVEKLPNGMEANENIIISKDGINGHEGGGMITLNADSMKGEKGSFSKSMAVVGSGKNGEKPMIMQSGQTSADYLVNLLKDTSRWTIERGVEFNGQKLDKFSLKGPVSMIVLYVDPATALPKVLRFGTPMKEGVTIEDVYEYGVQPK